MLSFNYSGVVQLVARQPLELVILVRVQAPEPILRFAPSRDGSPSQALRLRIHHGCRWYTLRKMG